MISLEPHKFTGPQGTDLFGTLVRKEVMKKITSFYVGKKRTKICKKTIEICLF